MAITTDPDAAVAAMDELVSCLFDIGDDINDAVVWLAEHWSADLPAPAWCSADEYRRGRPVLVLRVFCSPPDLVRIAELADVTPTVDRPRSGAARYGCARPFGTGRVELRANAFECTTDAERVARYVAQYRAKLRETER